MDVISLYQHGIQNAVATLGTATTIYHLKKLIRYSKKLLFVLTETMLVKKLLGKH